MCPRHKGRFKSNYTNSGRHRKELRWFESLATLTAIKTYWDQLVLMVQYHFPAAAMEAAHRHNMPVTEYCRQELLLRLAADGVRLDDYSDAVAA
jgi:hypothetical protein